jgi:hypothetical protein
MPVLLSDETSLAMKQYGGSDEERARDRQVKTSVSNGTIKAWN